MTVARRYASALADVLVDQNEEAVVREELNAWEQLVAGNPLLLEALTNPTVPYDQKGKVLNELIAKANVRPTTANFLRVLLRNQRFAELPQINAKLGDIMDERAGVVSAEVISARPISEPVRRALEETLQKITNRKVRLNFATDETLLGGIVTRIGSTIYDGSVRSQLERLGQELAS
ncbi:MAG TPA: ATP synthase F1 subunit delta [Pyrinomonadaceae bacterium]|nr:ATP synthase F1 subunit delta [Pyrinomonadaceae bacterium]